MDLKPKIAVITVLFNAQKTIAKCMESVAAQNYENLEHVIIDGASTDSSLALIEQHKTKNTFVYSEPDSGIYNAMNKGLANTTADFIIYLNADDCYTNPTVLSQMMNALQSNNLDAVCAGVHIFKANGNKPYRVYKATGFKKWMFLFGHQPPHPSFLCRRSSIIEVGGFNESYKIAGDFDLLLRLIYIKKIKWMTINLFAVKMLHGGASSGSSSKTISLNQEIIQALKQHKLTANPVLIYCKYFFKVFQLRL